MFENRVGGKRRDLSHSPRLGIINALGSSVRRRLLRCNNALYEYSVSRGTYIRPGLVLQAAVVRRRKGEGEEDVGPAGSPILIHSITADNDRVNGPPTLDELRGAPAPLRSLLRSPASPSNLIHAAAREEGGWKREGDTYASPDT